MALYVKVEGITMDGDNTNQQPAATPTPAPANNQAPAPMPESPTSVGTPAAGTPAPSAAPAPVATPASPAWAQYVGHIVRWEDGTSWLVENDGRHWIPDGGTYVALQQKGAQVFNLPADQLDQIPDIKGSQAHA